jgi:hypothetical protein
MDPVSISVDALIAGAAAAGKLNPAQYTAIVTGSGAAAVGSGAVAAGAGGIAIGGSVQGGIQWGARPKPEQDEDNG